MIKEEWRMHSELFGGRNFALFPLVVLAASAFLVASSFYTGFTVGQIEYGILALLFFLGLNVGSIGFISRDRAENLIGENNLLIYSSRTLPIQQRKIVSVFILKDLLYYSALFVAPLTLGLLSVNYFTSYAVSKVLMAWVAGSGMFMLGVSMSLAFASLYNLGVNYLLGFSIPLAGAIYYSSMGLMELTPLGFFSNPGISSFITGFLPFSLLALYSVAIFRPSSGRKSRTSEDKFHEVHDLLGYDKTGIVSKSVIQLLRSSGGVIKIFFSFGLIYAFYVFMMSQIPFLTAGTAAPGLVVALILSIASLSTYNWITLNDRPSTYTKFPVEMHEVFDAKLSLYLTVSVPVAWAFIAANTYIYGADGAIVGALSLPSISVYLVGVTAYLSGLEPNEMLFDAWKFTIFMFSAGAVLVPMFVAGLLYHLAPAVVSIGFLSFSLIIGLAGFHIFHEAARKWERENR
ncbi:putative membrane protein, putative permease [Candidatus Nanohalovita haloferacivicina]|nr:putative membrane protein, putative permease [Candidatus Nanohalobia archaeon BNXNv]